ncbi:MAG: hypothetical protein NVSMB52_20960 [Chloroflexota bacterium]
MQLGRIVLHAVYPAQYLGRAIRAVLLCGVRPVHLVGVVRHEVLVGGHVFGPDLRFADVPVDYPALHVEVRLNIALSRLPHDDRLDR